MNAVIGKVTTTQGSILVGDHHIVVAGSLASGQTELKAGMVLQYISEEDAYATVTEVAASNSCAVLLEDVADSDVVDVESIAVHGTVRREKLLIADGSPAPAAVLAALRAVGIFAV